MSFVRRNWTRLLEDSPSSAAAPKTTADASTSGTEATAGISIAERLFYELDDRLVSDRAIASGLDLMHVVVLTARDGLLRRAVRKHRARFGSLSITTSERGAMRMAKYSGGLETIVLLDLEALEDPSSAVPKLLHLRRANPGLTVLILSRTFSSDDRTQERIAIADCSLQLPVDEVSLLNGLNTALANARRRIGVEAA